MVFEAWFRQEWFQQDLEYNTPLIRWDIPSQTWWIYNEKKGYYEACPEEFIDSLIINWANGQMQTTQGKITHQKTRLKTIVGTQIPWDNDPVWENIQNGMLNLETLQLINHHPRFLCQHQVPRIYHNDISEWSILIYNEMLKSTPQWARLHRFLVAMVHKRHDDEMFLMLYGKRQTGKSTILQIPELLFGADMTSKTPLQKLGVRFGLKECYNKRVNIHPDLPSKQLSSESISLIKTLTGRDGYIEIEKKGVDSFKYPIQCFFAFGTNQLMEFAHEASQEVESIMRRACLCCFPNPHNQCPPFKDLIADPEFLDDIYSYLLKEAYQPIREISTEQWIEEALALWLENSNPILPLLRELYEYTGDLDDLLNAYEVKNTIQTALEEEGFLPPKDLLANITESFKAMRVYKDNLRGPKSNYVMVKKIGTKGHEPKPDTQSLIDEIINKPEDLE